MKPKSLTLIVLSTWLVFNYAIGNPPLVFGRRAHLNFDEGWTPWKRF